MSSRRPRRLGPRDAALLVLLVPIWLALLGVHSGLIWTDRLAWVPVYVEPAPEATGHPVVRAVWNDDVGSTVQPGDRLLYAGDRNLVGVGRVGFLAIAHELAGDSQRVELRVDRAGHGATATLHLLPVRSGWASAMLILALGVCGIIALIQGQSRRASRTFGLSAFSFAGLWSIVHGGPGWLTVLGFGVLTASAAVAFPVTLRAIQLFPESVASTSRLARWAPWAFSLTALAMASWLLDYPLRGEVGLRLLLLSYLLVVGIAIGLLTRNYRRADGSGRRQLRWVLLGFYVGVGPVLVAAAAAAARPELRPLYELSSVSLVALPICLCIALVRHGLFDVDRLIGAAATYSILTIVFMALALTLVPLIGEQLSTRTGMQSALADGLVALPIALAVFWSQARLRPRLEALLFPERAAFDAELRRMRAELRTCGDAHSLFGLLGRRLAEVLQLDSCVLYGSTEGLLVPVYARSPVVPPGFGLGDGLATLLRVADRPIDASRRPDLMRALPEPDRASLQSLSPDVLLPLRRGAELAAFVSLGPKQSGDVFTDVDLALLDGLVDIASEALLRQEDAELNRVQRDLHEKVAGYVPSAVIERLAKGDLPTAGEREVSVLFVDIRGYTSFSESREAPEIFEMVNAYTEAVSSVIGEYAGSVVEFHGDGLLAVFGAPAELPHKEELAVKASSAIIAAVDDLAERSGLSGQLGVGVGVATGPTYCGDIRSVDRRIWTVIGNTVNLAARLEGMTRNIDAGVVIDATTWSQCNEELAARFEAHPGVRVKGRSDAMTVYAIPLTAFTS